MPAVLYSTFCDNFYLDNIHLKISEKKGIV